MADADQLLDNGDDDWVAQALANAMFGHVEPSASSGATESDPPASSATESDPPASSGSVEAEPSTTSANEPESAVERPATDERAQPAIVPATNFRDEQPAAASSRLVERPTFDATNDPGVETKVSAERVTAAEPTSDDSDDNSSLRSTVEWLVVLGSAVIVALLLRAFLFQAFYIPSESMEETLRIDDRVLVNKLSYRLHDVHRGDVVVFRRPDEDRGEFRDLIKRVIGLPGESVEARNNTIYIDGRVLIEPYLVPGEVIGDFGPVEVPDGEYFVMGDNRDNSGDSRVFGPIESDRIIGRAFFLFWPFDRVGSL